MMKVSEQLNHWASMARLTSSKESILSADQLDGIAAAFQALEQRAEVAEADNSNYSELLSYHIDRQAKVEAKLAELEKQGPVAYTDNEQIADLHKSTFAEIYAPHDSFKGDPEWLALYLRPAPAINLAELVPDERSADSSDGNDIEAWFDEGWNACRAAILRKIEEAQ